MDLFSVKDDYTTASDVLTTVTFKHLIFDYMRLASYLY